MLNKITEGDKKILEQFPEYKEGEKYVGSRDYWEGVFLTETNRDPKLHEAFSELHKKIVDMVILFCKEHDLDVDEFVVGADGILGSKPFGEWTCSTDSNMSMCIRKKFRGESCEYEAIDRDHPFLYEI